MKKLIINVLLSFIVFLLLACQLLAQSVMNEATPLVAYDPSSPTNQTIKENHNDSAITAKVKGVLASNSLSHSITVATANSQVSLSGFVTSTEQAIIIVQLVEQVAGVQSVNNQLIVNDNNQDKLAGQYIEDIVITNEIKKSLFAEKDIPLLNIKINSIRGHVELTGKVKNKAQKKQVENIVKQVKGVVQVTNNLTVRS